MTDLAALRQNFISTIAIKSHRRGADEHLWFALHSLECPDERSSRVDSTSKNGIASTSGPSSAGHVFTRKIYDRIHTLQRTNVEFAGHRVPKQLVDASSWSSHEAQ